MAYYDSPDPYMTYDKQTGYYYCLFSEWEYLKIYRSRRAANILKDNDSVVILKWTGENSIYGSLWAPEMYKAENGRWKMVRLFQFYLPSGICWIALGREKAVVCAGIIYV